MSKRKHEAVEEDAATPDVDATAQSAAEAKTLKKARKAERKAAKAAAVSVDDSKVDEPVEDIKKRPAEADDKDAQRAAKKARKEARRAAKASATTSAAASGSSTPLTINKANAADVQAFLKLHDISYDPVEALQELPPLLAFDQMPVQGSLRAGVANFKQPTPIQASSWSVLFAGRDCIGIAETGSGKTLAFGIPALHHLQQQSKGGSKKDKKRKVGILVVAPTRELAMQTHETLADTGKSLGITAVCVYGGVPKPPQIQALRDGARIVVGTPGRILDLCNEGNLDLSEVTYLVLDEADRMLDKGFEQDIRNIISQTKPSLNPDGTHLRQTAMFSATWPQSVRNLANDFMYKPVRLTVGSDELTASTSISQSVIVVEDPRKKEQLLLKTLREQGMPPRTPTSDKVIAFALYKKEASRIESFLARSGYQVSCLQGDMSQSARTAALEQFKKGETRVLVATDVAARGLDLPKVELVINVTFPLTIEDYVHRIGRTGRAGRTGKAITFFTEEDKSHAGELQRVLREAGAEIPDSLKAFGGVIKKKVHPVFGAHYDESLAGQKGSKITFD